jgi:hypothetical protein
MGATAGELDASNAAGNNPDRDRRSRKRRRDNPEGEQDIVSTSEQSHREKGDDHESTDTRTASQADKIQRQKNDWL